MPVFVFGSNEAGRHGKGAALFARLHCGAIYGQAFGRQGDSYAIPTKDAHLRTLPLECIAVYARAFLEYARQHPAELFTLTAVGCGLAGYTPKDMAPIFAGAPTNVVMPAEFVEVLKVEGRA